MGMFFLYWILVHVLELPLLEIRRDAGFDAYNPQAEIGKVSNSCLNAYHICQLTRIDLGQAKKRS